MVSSGIAIAQLLLLTFRELWIYQLVNYNNNNIYYDIDYYYYYKINLNSKQSIIIIEK